MILIVGHYLQGRGSVLSHFRWVCRRIRVYRRVISLLVVTAILAIIFWSQRKTTSCDDDKARQFIDDLCGRYRRREAAGRYCRLLCDTQIFQMEKCSLYERGKKVLFMTCNSCGSRGPKRIVVKRSGELHDDKLVLFHESNGSLTADSLLSAKSVMRETVKNDFGIDIGDENVFSLLWGYDFDKFVKDHGPNATEMAIQNIWSLIRQPEYSFMKIHSSYPFVPRLYGSCGPVYVSEYTPPSDILLKSQIPSIGASDWIERARLAIRLLDLIQSLENDFHQPIHLCDAKGDNYGVNSRNELTLLDTDYAYYHDALLNQLKYSICVDDEDCDFYFCRGKCNTTTNVCVPTRANNNLQAICERVFLGNSDLTIFTAGLLKAPPSPIEGRLTSLLAQCSSPDGLEESRAPAPMDLVFKLQQLLGESLGGRLV